MVVDIEWSSLEGLTYLAFLKPRTQKEAVELIYNKDYQEVGITPFKQAREKLVQHGFVSSNGKLRNAEFQSSTEPIERYLDLKPLDKPVDHGKLKKLMGSEGFQEYFAQENFEDLPYLERNSRGRLRFQRSNNILNRKFDALLTVRTLLQNNNLKQIRSQQKRFQ